MHCLGNSPNIFSTTWHLPPGLVYSLLVQTSSRMPEFDGIPSTIVVAVSCDIPSNLRELFLADILGEISCSSNSSVMNCFIHLVDNTIGISPCAQRLPLNSGR
ncbi:hypothetical protein ABZP36_021569 [Zizania latifolia]